RSYLNAGSGMEYEDEYQRRQRPVADRPTETMFDSWGPRSIPAKPKIVVLGATGKIGRLVVKQLMQMKGVDMTIVAFVRDYDKAIKVLYDDVLVVGKGGDNNNKRGPKLQIVEGDLVPPEELPGYAIEDSEDEQIWKDTAVSASKWYGNDVKDYNNVEMLPDINEALEEAIKDATTIISCVGNVRPTNLWTDVLSRPFVRLLKADVSDWCQDGNHPYYIHYASTRKALGIAEREQLRREAAATAMAEAEGLDLEKDIFVPKIRFIRISDLNVGHNPWDIVPLMTNIVHSVVFRYQEMAEKILEESTLVETVVLRPGDLADEERDANTTAVQVSSSGRVPTPARIGREDVAALAVASATFITQNRTDENGKEVSSNEPFHYNFACRWVGQEMDPYPAQGRKRDGHEDEGVAFRRSLRAVHRNERANDQRRMRRATNGNDNHSKRLSSSSSRDLVTSMAKKLAKRRQRHRRAKPHGAVTAIAIYMFMALTFKTMILPSLQYVPGGPEYILPAIQRINGWFTLWLNFAAEHFKSLLAKLMRRKKVYISF
ncbi:MAG: hypothetical protein SGILL_010248, partial [Bacillariaceae sp.]